MKLARKSILNIVAFLILLLSTSTTTLSQERKQQHKKQHEVKTEVDSSQGKNSQSNKDTLVTQKGKIDLIQHSKIDSVKKEVLRAENEIQKQLQILLTLNKSNFDSLKRIVGKKDSTFNLRLDTLVEQTKQEGFWRGFVRNSVYTWLYETMANLFSSKKDASGSIVLKVFTLLAIVVRFILLVYRLKDYFGEKMENSKPNKLRLVFSFLSWLILLFSFFSYSQNKEDEYLKSINDQLKKIEENGDNQINAVLNTDDQFNTLLQAINKESNTSDRYEKMESMLKAQAENLARSQKQIQILSELQNAQASSQTIIVDHIKDYSTHGFWIFFITVIIIFGGDIRNVVGEIWDRLK